MQVDMLRMLDDAELRAIAGRLVGDELSAEDRQLRAAVQEELEHRTARLPAPRPVPVTTTDPGEDDRAKRRRAAFAAAALLLVLVSTGAVMALAAGGDAEAPVQPAGPTVTLPAPQEPPRAVPLPAATVAEESADAPAPDVHAGSPDAWRANLDAIPGERLPVDVDEVVDGLRDGGLELAPASGVRIDDMWDAACVHTGFAVDCDRGTERPAAIAAALQAVDADLRGVGLAIGFVDVEDPRPRGRLGAFRLIVTRWSSEAAAVSFLEQLLLLEGDARVVQLGTTGDRSPTIRRALGPCTGACDVQELLRVGDRVVMASARYEAMPSDLASVDSWRRAPIGEELDVRIPG